MKKTVLLFAMALAVVVFGACTTAATPVTPTPAKPAPTASAPTSAPAPVTPTAAAKPPAPTAAPAAVRVKMGIIGSYSDVMLFMAEEKGFFKEQGIEMEYVSFKSATEIVPPVGTGEIDIGAMVVSPALLNAKDRGIDLRLVASKSRSMKGFESYWILLRKDLADLGQVKTPADLKGMKMAIFSRGSVAQQAAELALAKGGLTEKDMAGGEFDVLGRPDYAPAFANKAIAAGFHVEPFSTAIEQQGLAIKWIGGSTLFPGNGVEGTSIAFSPKMAANQDLGRRWMVAYLQGARQYLETLKTKEGRSQVAARAAKYISGDVKTFEAMEPDYIDPNGTLDTANLEFLYRWIVGQGLYTGKTTFKDVIDSSFSEYAVQNLGKYQ